MDDRDAGLTLAAAMEPDTVLYVPPNTEPDEDMQHSLFGEILDWMLTPLLLLWPVSLALTWLVAQSIAGKPFDRALEYNVQALAQLVTIQEHRVAFNLPQPAREMLRADDSDQIYYQVRGPRTW